MNKHVARGLAVLSSATALLLGATPLTASASTAPGRTLVIDNSFVLVTADPGHMFEPTGELVDNALYDTLLTFYGGNFKKVVPDC